MEDERPDQEQSGSGNTPAAPTPPRADPPKRWHAGTLTYTTGGLVVLFIWLLGGDFGFYLKERAVPPTLQVLLSKYEVSDFVLGLIIASLPQFLWFVVGPVVGYRSDRHRSRWGRRIPFLLGATPFAVIAMMGLALSPNIGRTLHEGLGDWSPGENTSVVLSLVISWTVFELSTIVCNSLFVGLINDVVPREVIGRFFAMFRIVSLAAGMIFNYYLFGFVEDHFFSVFAGIGLLYGVSFTLMCLKVKEGEYPPPEPEDPEKEKARPGPRRWMSSVRTYFRECFAIPYYRWVFVGVGLSYMASTPLNVFSVFYARSLDMSMGSYGKYSAVQLLFSLIQAYPIGWLADKFHPLRLTMVSMVLMGGSGVLAFFLVHDASSFGIAHVICGTFSGFWGTCIVALPPVLFPKARFATLASALHITHAAGQMLLAPLVGWSLDALGRDYRFVYMWTALISGVSLASLLVVYRKFIQLGGPANYKAPK